MDIKEKIKDLPASPGVYLFKDTAGEVLYVGKAADLRKRVSSYLRPHGRLSVRIEAMISKARDLDYMPTSTAAEALIYENSLIKQYRPHYNVALRDDKSYPLLKLTVSEKFPRLVMTRRKKDDGAAYYGPYASAGLLKEALGIMRRIFPLRTCGRLGNKLCLAFHIGQCLGPCAGKVDEAVYKTLVEEVKLFLDGKREELTEFIGSRMKAASERRDFEEAERLRRRMEALAAVRKERISYRPHEELEELKSILGLESMPDHIEAFDVSNIMGELAVGSMIYFHKGRPKRGAYRRFRIKTVSAIDDYAMMREVVRRRYKRVLEERGEVPGLVLIDGGRGHLQAALEELGRLGMAVPVVAIAKEYEKLYTKGRDPIVLPKDSKALHLLQRIRDEAHRFAIAYHKLLMSKGVAHSALDEIEGIGPKRLRALLLRFGSVEDIKKASKDELLKVRGMNDKAAQAIISHFSR